MSSPPTGAACQECGEIFWGRGNGNRLRGHQLRAHPSLSKTCARCKKEKLRSDFFQATGTSDGNQAYCKECASEKKGVYADDPEAGAASRRAWRAKNPGRDLANQRAWSQAHRAELRERDRARRPRTTSTGGFDRTRPAIVYLVTHPVLNAHKIGIYNVGGRRATRLRARGWEIYKTRLFSRGADAHDLEQAGLEWIRTELHLPPYLDTSTGDGWSETVSADAISLPTLWMRLMTLS